MTGRGRGDAAKPIPDFDEPPPRPPRPGQFPLVEVEKSSSSDTSSHGSDNEQATIRGRGGFRSTELRLIPENIPPDQVRAPPDEKSRPIELLCNYIELSPLKDRQVYQYRIDFEPEIDSLTLRRRLFMQAFEGTFSQKVMFDGMHDARSSYKSSEETTSKTIDHPNDPGTKITITVKLVGVISGGFEMIRIFNINMKIFLRLLGFYQISSAGAYIHPSLSNPVGGTNTLMTVRGFRTAANVHEEGKILMNLESVHKLMQRNNVLEHMVEVRRRSSGGNLQELLKAGLIGKLVVTNYNKIAYRIEDINFNMKPTSTFHDRRANSDVSYVQYYQQRYGVQVTDMQQPLLLVVQNNKRKRESGDEPATEVYLIPEFCNIAGLTDQQRADNRLKIDLVRCSQIPPQDRVAHIQTFLSNLHSNQEVKSILDKWGYTYGKEPVSIKARTLPPEGIGFSNRLKAHEMGKTDAMGSFDRLLQNEKIFQVPAFPKMCVIIARSDLANQGHILGCLQAGFRKVGLNPISVNVIKVTEGDSAQNYVNHLKSLAPDITATLVIMHAQNKERYDAIKKIASVERGMVTQVVTARLMMDERKASGAAVKIGIQIAAKIGGEPWFVHLPLPKALICGYDTYHDTAHRGRSFGAFVASTNDLFTRWYSKADSHDRIDELSSHLCENLGASLRKYREANNSYPSRVILYRDGVSDGQLEHVFKVELKQLKKACKDADERIKLTVIVVNKRIGARFYMKNGGTIKYHNAPPGSVVDTVVTRKERYDFYLISQATRNGTVAPTYYNIIHDESGLDAGKHQAMAYKMCHMYFNWSGTVRVPAPCQYAHKLALLCGEHLHTVPNSNLDDRLHFL